MLIQDARSITLRHRSPAQPSKTQFLLQTDADAWGWISKSGTPPADPQDSSPSTRSPTSPGPLTIAAAVRRRHHHRPDDQGDRCSPRASSPSAPRNFSRTMPPSGRRQFLHQLPRLAREEGRRPRHRAEKAAAVRHLAQPHFLPHRGLDRRCSSSRPAPAAGHLHLVLAPQISTVVFVMFRNSSTYIYLAVALGLFCYVTFIDKKIPGTKEREEAETQLFNVQSRRRHRRWKSPTSTAFSSSRKIDGHWEIKKPGQHPRRRRHHRRRHQPDRLRPAPAHHPGRRQLRQRRGQPEGMGPQPRRRTRRHPHQGQDSYELLVGRKMAINDSVYARASGRKTNRCASSPARSRTSWKRTSPISAAATSSTSTATRSTQVATRIADTSTTPGQASSAKSTSRTASGRSNCRSSRGLPTPMCRRSSARFSACARSTSSSMTPAISAPTDSPRPRAHLSPSTRQDGRGHGPRTSAAPCPDKPDQVYAQRLKSNSVFTLTKSIVDDVAQSRAQRARPPRPSLRPQQGHRPEPTPSARKKAELQADHALWNTVGDAAGRADVGKVNDLLAKLSQLETTPVLKDSATDLKPFGLDKPQGKITIASPEFNPAPRSRSSSARTKTSSSTCAIPPSPSSTPCPTPRSISCPRTTSPCATPAPSTSSRPGQEHDHHRRHRTARHPRPQPRRHVERQQRQGPHGRLDQGRHAGRLFCQLQAKTWLGPVLPAYGLAKPVLTIAVLADQPTPTILHIGAPCPTAPTPRRSRATRPPSPSPTATSVRSTPARSSPSPQALSGTNAPAAAPPATNAAGNSAGLYRQLYQRYT